MMASNDPHRHHYVPQFYLNRFACHDDENKVTAISAHDRFIVADRKSIARIGYEEKLYDFEVAGRRGSLETVINQAIETPFSQGPTWQKVVGGRAETLDESDRGALYRLIHHLQRRNIETLRFIEAEQRRVATEGFGEDASDGERAMHAWLGANPQRAHAFFLAGISNEAPYVDDAAELGFLVFRSKLRFRTSTNPVMFLGLPPEEGEPTRQNGDAARTWWLPLDPYCGVMMSIGASFTGFSNSEMPEDSARGLNLRYVVQLLQGLSVRYVLAEDRFLEADIVKAGFELRHRTQHGFRFERQTVS